MAKVPCRLSNKFIYLLVCLDAIVYTHCYTFFENNLLHFSSATFLKQTTENEDYKRVEFKVRGRHITSGQQIKLTQIYAEKGTQCSEDNAYNATQIGHYDSISSHFSFLLPVTISGEFFFCLPLPRDAAIDAKLPPNVFISDPTWLHQGANVSIYIPPSKKKLSVIDRSRRDIIDKMMRIDGLKVETATNEVKYDENGVPDLLAETEYVLRLFGRQFISEMTISFTTEDLEFGEQCQVPVNKGFSITPSPLQHNTVLVNVTLPTLKKGEDSYYICIKEGNYSSTKNFVHQGTEYWLKLRVHESLLPLWLTILIICLCLMFSALFSGLNLGLMSLDRTELKILCNTGTSKERKYAKTIQPVRNHGNYLLCSILLGNVFVNSIFTILLDGLTSGAVAVVCSTISIVLIGEITPQAICSRHGLAVGAKTIFITKIVMCLTFPLAYPVSKILDWLLGEEIGNVYNRERLKELVKVTTGENDLDKDEVNIISGALELRKKTVADVMTKIEDVFMLDYDAILDFETVSEIMKSGFSRVPVYEGNRQNIVTMLYIKDLAFVDPDDNTPLKTLCQFYQNPCNFVFEDVTLDVMFRIFKEGNKGHMAFVHRVNNEGEGDPFYETVGLITLEDVIEELIQAEIMDETDVFTDNRTKRRRNAERRQDFSAFAERRNEGNKIQISPQLTLAAFQFLSTSVEQFLPNVISETILKRLLKQNIVHHIKKNKEWRTDPNCIIYQQGKICDYFVLILEGRVEVTIGKENLLFEGGPFTYFGTQALATSIVVAAESPSVPTSTLGGSIDSLNMDAMLKNSFQPDYTVKACTEVVFLRIKRNLYNAAKRASLMQRSQQQSTTDQFDEEVDKLLYSVNDDDPSSSNPRSPQKRPSKQFQDNNAISSGQQTSLSPPLTTSPKSPILYSNVSPPHRIRDINGSIKSSPVDEVISGKEEEISLLTKNL